MPALFLAADLPAPPALERWVLEQPWPLAIGLFGLGAAVFLALTRREQGARGALFGGVVAALGIAAAATGLIVRTDREQATALTADFINLVFASDAAGAERLISSHLVVASAGEIFDGFGKPELVSTIRGFERFKAQEWSLRLRGAAEDAEGVIRTHATIRVRTGYVGNQELPSTWEFTWRAGADGQWLLARVECISMWGRPPTYNWERDARIIGRESAPRPSEGALQRERY